MKKLLRFAAVAATGLGLAAPAMVSAQTASVSTSGPNSKAHVTVHNKNWFDTKVKNNIGAKNTNNQSSNTGNASAHNNTTVGNVGTGNASVDNAASTTVTLDNSNATSACGCDTGADQNVDATTEGPNSPVKVDVKNESKVTTQVTNNVTVDNNNKQTAKSGNASASNNTSVGDVTSGDASASNSTVTELNITN